MIFGDKGRINGMWNEIHVAFVGLMLYMLVQWMMLPPPSPPISISSTLFVFDSVESEGIILWDIYIQNSAIFPLNFLKDLMYGKK